MGKKSIRMEIIKKTSTTSHQFTIKYHNYVNFGIGRTIIAC